MPRMRNRNPANDKQIIPPESEELDVKALKRPGRPRGHRLSAESRRKISEARQKQEQERRARAKKVLPATFPALTEVMRESIVRRDGMKCRSCGDPGPKLAVHTFLYGLDDLNKVNQDPELSAVMCSFCRDVADTLEAPNMAALLRQRW